MKPQSDLHSVDHISWTEISTISSLPTSMGRTEKILSIDPNNPENVTRLAKMEKGFRTYDLIRRPFWEEIFVLKGSLVDEGNKVIAEEGYYCCRHPGMPHGPFYYPEECIALEISYVPKKGIYKPQTDFHSIEDIPWTPIGDDTSSAKGEGITEKILSIDPNNPENVTRLVRLEKGVRTGAVSLSHSFWEEVLVLKGHMLDEGNKLEVKKGYYCCRHPGMPHGPFYIVDETVSFEIHYKPKE